MSLIGSLVSFVITLPLITNRWMNAACSSSKEKSSWIERFHISYYLGVDGISMWFVVLTAFITVIVVISAWEVITERVAQPRS